MPNHALLTIAPGLNHLSITLVPTQTIGPQGPRGEKGVAGETGAAGPPGDERRITVHEHQPHGRWSETVHVDGMVELRAIGCTLLLGEVYEGLPA